MSAFSLTRPVLNRGRSLAWPAQRRWTWGFFASMSNERLELSDAGGNPSLVTTVRDYVSMMLDGPTTAQLYASGWRFFEQRPDMLDDFQEPIAARRDVLQRIPEELFKPLLWLMIGGDNSGTALHYDVLGTHAWLTVIEGKKRLALHPPASWDLQYESKRKRARQVLDMRRNCGPWRYLEIGKGDLLFIPAGWWHEVVNDGPTIGLTRNFASPDIVAAVAARVREAGYVWLLPWLKTEVV